MCIRDRSGTSVPHDTAIDVVLSKGREPLTVPSLNGMRFASLGQDDVDGRVVRYRGTGRRGLGDDLSLDVYKRQILIRSRARAPVETSGVTVAFYQALKATGSPVLKAAYHPWIRGKENIPAEGPAILASNHNAVWDSVFLPMMLDREVVFMGKADYFTGTGLKGWMTKEFMRAVGTIPVDRTGGRASEAALNAGLKRLRDGELFGIYPEGTRSPDAVSYTHLDCQSSCRRR